MKPSKRFAVAGAFATLLIAQAGFAKIDTRCSSTTATSAITGVVQNAKGNALQGMQIELYTTNRNVPSTDTATTDASGRYLLCVGQVSGNGHDTYDVHARDLGSAPLYALASQPYTTYTSPASDADFTPASGTPLLYLTNITISPSAISTAARAVPVTWTVRSKAPSFTRVELTLEHRGNSAVAMTPLAAEDGGPAAGGWNVWGYSDTIAARSLERVYAANARGFDGATETTQRDTQFYSIDNSPPILGPASTNIAECGPGIPASAFSPASPPGTTNPLAIVTHGVCDKYSNGARTGLDPYSLSGKICRDALLSVTCEDIRPVLNVNSIVWYPPEALPLGDYYFGWRIADYAGNETSNPVGYKMSVVARGGQTPLLTAVTPGNLGSGSTSGVIIGSSVTSPGSYPTIGFRVLDNDGQRDLVPGSLRVRVYYGDERTLVYEYDIGKGRNEYDSVTKRGGANWDLGTGFFRADGYPLQFKPPGRYVATASISDRGGNSTSITWHWLLAAAV